ncbi:MAG: RraA family protein [Chloroflexi bacterium]|nr:RraA family protein [Chloroflexota bacterium]
MSDITAADLAALARYNTPTICNVIEVFDVRPRNVGFNLKPLHCLYPDLPPIVGFATTACVRSYSRPQSQGNMLDYYSYVEQSPKPAIAVVQDLDEDWPGAGALWGEVNANIHKALGCLGVVTNGCVRDVDDVRPLGFQMIAGSVMPSHAYIRVEGYGEPVNIFGMDVRSGDIIHADRHGAAVIPPEIVRDIPAAVARLEAGERQTIALCQSAEFSVAKLRELRARQSGPAH